MQKEIFCLGAVWTIVLGPLWVKLRKAYVKESIDILKAFVTLATDAQTCDPVSMMTDPRTNIAIRVSQHGNILYYTFP